MSMTRKLVFQQGPPASPVLHPAEDTRLTLGGLWAPDGADGIKVRSGVVWGPGASASAAPMTVAAPSASTVTVTPGRFVIQSTTALAGAWAGTVDSTYTRTLNAGQLPGAGQFKAGRVLVHVYDTVYGDGSDNWDIELAVGLAASTAGGAPPPAMPNNALQLATFTVDSSGNITLSATPTYTATNGAPIPVYSTARPANPWNGCRIWEIDTGRTWQWAGAATGWVMLLGDTGWQNLSLTPPLTVGGGGARYRAKNGAVGVHIDCSYNGAYNNNAVFTNLPVGSRPMAPTYAVATTYSNGPFYMWINTNGDVASAGAQTATGVIIDFTFLAA